MKTSRMIVGLSIAFMVIGLVGSASASAYFQSYEVPSYSVSWPQYSGAEWCSSIPVVASFDSSYVSFGYSTICDGIEQAEEVTIPIPESNQNEIEWISELENGITFYGYFSSFINREP